MKAIIPIIIFTVIGVIISSALHGGFKGVKIWPSSSSHEEEREKPQWMLDIEADNKRMRDEAAAEVQRILNDPGYVQEGARPVSNIKEAREREEAALNTAIQREQQALDEVIRREREAIHQAILDAGGELP